MNIDLPSWTLMIDAGLVVLIWLVQLVIYPGFAYADREKLYSWHESYTARITCVVAPLMFAQLGLIVFSLAIKPLPIECLSAVLISICWATTFLLSVPAHNRIQTFSKSIARDDTSPPDGSSADATVADSSEKLSREQGVDTAIASLIRTNWIRTMAWSMILVVDILRFGDRF